MSGFVWSDPDLFGRRVAVAYQAPGVMVREISKSEADGIVRALHYSRSVVWSSSVHLGVFDDSTMIGVLQFGPGMNPGSGGSVVAGSTPDSWLELNRMVFVEDKPRFAASQAIAGSLRLLRQWRPAVEWVQSFADERCGKFGAVYQAASFLYCGSHVGKFVEIDGEIFHQSMVSRPMVDKRGWGCGPKVTWALANKHRARPVQFRQFRYVKPLTRKARQNLLLPTLGYPKPVQSALETAA